MKIIVRVFFVTLISGIMMILLGVSMGLDGEKLDQFFTDVESFGERIDLVIQEPLQKISIDVDYKHVILKYHEHDYVMVSYYNKNTDQTSTYIEDRTFTFIQKRGSNLSGGLTYKYPSEEGYMLHVYLPYDLVIDFELRIDHGYLDVETDDVMHFNNIYIRSDKAMITMGQIKANDVSINVYQAFLGMKGFEIERLSIDAHDNEVTLVDGHVDRLNVTLRDGHIEIYAGSYNMIQGISNHGMMHLIEVDVNNTIDLTSESGEIFVKTSQTKLIKASTQSGLILVYVIDTSSYKMNFSTDHGRIDVNNTYMGQSFTKNSGSLDMILTSKDGHISVNMSSAYYLPV